MGVAMGIDDDCDILIVFDASVENTATETLGKPSKRCLDHIKESHACRNTITTPIYEMQRATIELDAIRRHLQTLYSTGIHMATDDRTMGTYPGV